MTTLAEAAPRAASAFRIEREGDLAVIWFDLPGEKINKFSTSAMEEFAAIVDEMEREFKTARDLDAKFDYAGPDRSLGLLYFQAPGWPASIGSKAKARQHLQRAALSAPGYPENHLCLLEAYLKWGDKKSLRRELQLTEGLLPQARKEFTGEAWDQIWVDWDKRWTRIREKTSELE